MLNLKIRLGTLVSLAYILFSPTVWGFLVLEIRVGGKYMLFCIFQSRTGCIIPTSSDLIGMRIECSKLFRHAVKKIIQTASVARSSQAKTNRT